MKLDEELKQKIDSYFANINADELYDKLINQYSFPVISEELYIDCSFSYVLDDSFTSTLEKQFPFIEENLIDIYISEIELEIDDESFSSNMKQSPATAA